MGVVGVVNARLGALIGAAAVQHWPDLALAQRAGFRFPGPKNLQKPGTLPRKFISK